MIRRPYRGEEDVARVQVFNATEIAEHGMCGHLHPGDIAHRLFNGNKLFAPADVLTIWESGSDVAAWLIVSPRHGGFDAQVGRAVGDRAFEREVLAFAEHETAEMMQRHGIENRDVETEIFRDDTSKAELLNDLGWTRSDEAPYVLNRSSLREVAVADVPPGYTIRTVSGTDEAAALAEVHAASFGSTWTPELYRAVMESPGYAVEREYVAEADDGSLAAFTVTWHDHVNRTGLFEPVGTHHLHRRRGVGRALLLTAMRGMRAAGMDSALVVSEGTNEASRALYHSVGFRPEFLLDTYTKPLPS